MRNVPSYIADRLKKNIQTRANNSAPSAKIWISRPSTVLIDEQLLERQTVVNSSVTDVSIAVSHPRMRRSNASIFMAYISGGVARVVTSMHKLKMDAHNWSDTGFARNASAVSIAFDGTMPRASGSEIEFVTETDPWVFWVDSSALYGQKLYSNEDPVILAETNCSDVSAVRAMWSNTGNFDFGLVVFFILEGKLYYRQLIDGEWMDAEVVNFGPDVVWTDIAASRSWDYRVVLQAMASDGTVYELFTQYMGIGQRSTEHIELKAAAQGSLGEIQYRNATEKENIIVGASASGGLTYALSSMPVSAVNIADAEENWGKLVTVRLDYPVTMVQGNGTAFSLFDSNGVEYRGVTSEASDDGLSVTISFTDFNNAFGECSLRYTPGTIQSPATPMEAWSISFLPVNLVPVAADPPKVVEVWNE